MKRANMIVQFQHRDGVVITAFCRVIGRQRSTGNLWVKVRGLGRPYTALVTPHTVTTP